MNHNSVKLDFTTLSGDILRLSYGSLLLIFGFLMLTSIILIAARVKQKNWLALLINALFASLTNVVYFGYLYFSLKTKLINLEILVDS